MPRVIIYNEIEFHGVGQGLFCSGSLRRSRNHGAVFHWVYDCGTSSKQSILQEEINEYFLDVVNGSTSRPTLDLVTISHFDSDHISGLVSLLSRFNIDTLLLPYMQLEIRLDIAFAEGTYPQDPLMQFYVNPVAYIAGAAEKGAIKQFVFVPGSGGGEGQPVPPTEPPKEWPSSENRWNLDFEADDELSLDRDPGGDFASLNVAGRKIGAAVRMLRPRSPIRVSSLWEFIPYNDVDLYPHNLDEFYKIVIKKRELLINADIKQKSRNALADLKSVYDDEFGTSAYQRNAISLFLYTGPVFKLTEKASTLYTGDGYLDSPHKVDSLECYLGSERLRSLHFFQVMHHGSKKNWFPGLAARINPRVSVFSSDPDNKAYGHPDADVLRDFWQFCPIMAGMGGSLRYHFLV